MKNDEIFDIELTPDLIIRAYMAGIFPMSESADNPDIFWVSPEIRGIIPLEDFHISKSLQKSIAKNNFKILIDNDFEAVIKACATYGSDRDSTWINQTIIDLYSKLFERKICHSVEVYEDDKLVGGLYGLSLGSAFFGESMFHKVSNASKIALAYLVYRLKFGGYSLLDTQFITPHLRSMGGKEITREEYEELLSEALKTSGDFYQFAGGGTSLDILQSTNQIS